MRNPAVAVLLAILCCACRTVPHFDVVVYGGTPAGIMAALAAEREGVSVLLVEPGKYLGGMVAGGLGRTDIGEQQYIGGMAADYFNAVAAYTPAGEQTPERPWDLEAKVAARVFDSLLSVSGCEVIRGVRLSQVMKEGNRITEIVLENGKRYRAKVFIDAGYEGDLMARSGVFYIVGRESRDTYDEPCAGFYNDPEQHYAPQDYALPCPCLGEGSPVHYLHNTQFGADIPAYGNGILLSGISREGQPEAGSGDSLTQAYNFRVTATRRDDLRVPWPEPQHYESEYYTLLLRYIEAHPGIVFSKLVHFGRLPNGKYDINANGPFTTDYVGGNTAYPDGDYAARERIVKDHEDYQKGFFWFLSHDPRVPEALREEVNGWGLCRDEFTDNGHWPHQLYVREGRRMKGAYVMTQTDITADVRKTDAVGMGSFKADSHPVQRWADSDGMVREEGHFLVETTPYQIPLRAIVPVREECANLLVPVCLSASHVAYGSIRMEPVYMLLGHAAGVAAAMTAGADIQDTDITQLQDKLARQGQVLSAQDVTDNSSQ